MNLFFKHAFNKDTILRSVKVSLVVGTILALLNHYNHIEGLTSTYIIQILLTYLVPFCVNAYGSATHGAWVELQELIQNKIAGDEK